MSTGTPGDTKPAPGARGRQPSASQALLLVTAWRDLDTVRGFMQTFTTIWQLAPGDEKLPPGASLDDVASWPFFFYFREGKMIFGILEARKTHLESLEEF